MDVSKAGTPVLLPNTSVPVHRILGRNPGPMTGSGTNSYLIGDKELSLLDPGPRDDAQFDNFIEAIAGRKLSYILITHTHGDHSPGALRLQEATGAELVGLEAPEFGGHDQTFKPLKLWLDGDVIKTEEYSVRLIHTPGHVSNHFCFLLEQDQLLFTGDHILQGTTSVILPPDGDMSHYLDSLAQLERMPLRALAPGHGEVMTDPGQEIRLLMAHRLKRERKVLDGLKKLGRCTLDELVVVVYDDVGEHLIPWAKKTLTAHLIKLERDGALSKGGEHWQIL
ncbi:MAG: glyoxylase-like metal-dependent hydrolase (beta-lactamase superfamily II) [Pseudohongiellaceae bacterium]|jgi:glyoxylase-like metal-dependent hydrolase (beta-lactamase superfamily II)